MSRQPLEQITNNEPPLHSQEEMKSYHTDKQWNIGLFRGDGSRHFVYEQYHGGFLYEPDTTITRDVNGKTVDHDSSFAFGHDPSGTTRTVSDVDDGSYLKDRIYSAVDDML